MERTTWADFTRLLQQRRQGDKDGPNFIPAIFRPEPSGDVRRLKENVVSRTAIALDIETNDKTGEVPPPLKQVEARIEAQGWAAGVYTSHSHNPSAPRYRIVVPLSDPIAPELPAPEVVAEMLALRGVLDTGKVGASSLFYLPSAKPGEMAQHEAAVIEGEPIAADWMTERAGAILAEREAERQRQRDIALEAAAKRREDKIRAGHDPESSIIEAIRSRLDLHDELVGHGYEPAGKNRYLFPRSESREPGVHTQTGRDGVERVYSHHDGDPLASHNLPSWCQAKAVDVVDVVTILDFSGDQKAALRTLARRFEINTSKSSARAAAPLPNGPEDYGSIRQKKPRSGPDEIAPEPEREPLAAKGQTVPPPKAREKPTAAEINAGINETVDEMNSRYMLVNEAGRAIIYQPGHDPVLQRRQLARLTTRDLQTFFMNDRISVGFNKEGSLVYKTKADVWLGHPRRRQYINGVVFDPSGVTPAQGVLNLWQGFGVTPAPGKWSILRDHIMTNICCGNEEHYGYLMGWMARLMQRPAEQGEVAVVLKGGEGTGKGTLAKALLRILGQHAFRVSDAKHLTGHFNGHLRDCVFLFADEAFYAGDKQHVSVLKSLITEPILTIEAKFQNATQTPNMLHLLMASNEEWVVPAALDARRFFVLLVSDRVASNHEYFAELWAEMDTGGYEAMLHDLLSYDLSKFNVRAVPTTAALQQQRKLSLPIPLAWWQDCLHRGFVFQSKIGLEPFFSEWQEAVSTDLLFASYTEFAKQHHERHPMSRETLGRFFSDMGCEPSRLSNAAVGEHIVDDTDGITGRLRTAKVIRKPRPPGYAVGDLEAARMAFSEHTKLPVDWGPPDEKPVSTGSGRD